MLRSNGRAGSILAQRSNDSDTNTVTLNNRVALCKWMVRSFIEQVSSEYGKRCLIFLPG